MEAPATPTMDFRSIDATTFELFEGSSATQNRKRRRSSLRRVSFAEQPSIHVFARDDDYETPPEGTMSRFSTQSSPTSDCRSPQRRSERLSSARGGRQDDNEVDKENVQVSGGNIVHQRRRGRRPLALRDTQKEDEEEFVKPSNWLDDRENSTLGSCDENTGPVDLRHITMDDQTMAVEDDDNMTMDSQAFHTRMSQMLTNRPLHRLSEGTKTPGHFSDMSLTVLWPKKKAQEEERELLDQPTWHRGEDTSDMRQDTVEVILGVLAKKKSSRNESSIHDMEESTMEDLHNWTEDDAQARGRVPGTQVERSEPLGAADEVSMETSSPVSNADTRKLFVDEGEQNIKDVSDGDMTDRYQEGITEAMPKLTSVLGHYNCESPSVEPLNRIFQRKSDVDAEDSPVFGLTAEIDIKKEISPKKGDDINHNRTVEEKELVFNRDLEEDTEEMESNVGKIRNVFQNPEDTFSFKGHQTSARETYVSKSVGQNQDVQDEDATADFTDQHNWRAEVSSDMSTTPLSPRRSKHFQRLLKAQTEPMQIDMVLTNSPSFQDDVTAAIPNARDFLAADTETPESELGWNPRKIVWSARQSNLHDLGHEVVLPQAGKGHGEDEGTLSMADKLCTPRAEKKHVFECLSEAAAKTLDQVSHSKEVRNSAASKMLLRMMSLGDNGCAPEESSPGADETQEIPRRTLHFQPDSDSQLESRSLRGDEQQISARDPDGTMEVESNKDMDEDIDSNESRVESLQQESRKKKLLQDMQVAEERLVALERRSEELRKRAEDYHHAIAKKCRNDTCSEMKGTAASCSYTHFVKLKKRFQLLNCMQLWDLKSTKIGDEFRHEFKYWALFTHSVFERMDSNHEFTVFKSSIDLNETSINQVYRHMNASLAWRWFLSGHEKIVQPQSLFNHVQGVHSKVMILMDLMKDVNNCRIYLVVPHFQLQTGAGLRLNLQFSDSKPLFDFVLSFDIKQVTQLRYMSKSPELDCATEMNQKLDCAVKIESAGRCFGKKITAADIKRSVSLVIPGQQLLLRVCASIRALMLSLQE